MWLSNCCLCDSSHHHHAVKCISDGFDEQSAGCDGDTVYICGSFHDAWASKTFVAELQRALSPTDQCGIAVESQFCQ